MSGVVAGRVPTASGTPAPRHSRGFAPWRRNRCARCAKLAPVRLFNAIRSWLAARRETRAQRLAIAARHELAMRRAVDRFVELRQRDVMGAHVLGEEAGKVIVRVMYLTDHIPPDRAWFAVPATSEVPRELRFEEVQHLETGPWR